MYIHEYDNINIIHFFRMKERYSTHFAKICLLWFLIYVEFLIILCHTDNILKKLYRKIFYERNITQFGCKDNPREPQS